MNFKQFFILNEQDAAVKVPRTATLTAEQFKESYETNCSEFDPHNNIIYRGIRRFVADYGYNDPRQQERPASSGKSYFMWLIESYKSWQHYPKRSRSIVATTSEKYAMQYGKTYYTIPYNGVQLGECTAYDFFQSFFDEDLNVIEINDFLIQLMTYVFKPEDYGAEREHQNIIPNKETFLQYAATLDKKLNEILKNPKMQPPFYAKPPIFTGVEKTLTDRYNPRSGNIMKKFKEDLAPELHGFRLLTLAEYNQPENPIEADDIDPGVEVWFSHPSLLVACQEGKTLAEILAEIGIK